MKKAKPSKPRTKSKSKPKPSPALRIIRDAYVRHLKIHHLIGAGK